MGTVRIIGLEQAPQLSGRRIQVARAAEGEALEALLQRQQLGPGARAAELGDARAADAMVGLWRDQARPVRAGGA